MILEFLQLCKKKKKLSCWFYASGWIVVEWTKMAGWLWRMRLRKNVQFCHIKILSSLTEKTSGEGRWEMTVRVKTHGDPSIRDLSSWESPLSRLVWREKLVERRQVGSGWLLLLTLQSDETISVSTISVFFCYQPTVAIPTGKLCTHTLLVVCSETLAT